MLGLSGFGSWFIFIAYMVFCINQGILVTWTQNTDKGYSYNATAAILHADSLKLIVAIILALRCMSLSTLCDQILKNLKVLALYFIPALLYAIYNNLAFVNLSRYDPTSYYILLQLKVVISGVIYQCLFSRQLSVKQWLSLVLLTVGCMVRQTNMTIAKHVTNNDNDKDSSNVSSFINLGIIFILVQLSCATFAGVYNELLLKSYGNNLNIWIHNIFMYINSIVCGLLIFAASGQPFQKLFFLLEGSPTRVYRLKVVGVVCNMAAMGLVTSIFLKSLNSIVKNFATASELIITAVLSWLIFGIPITLFVVVAMVIVLISVYVYSSNPLIQKPVPLPGTKLLPECDANKNQEANRVIPFSHKGTP